jgi:hypothetical protein
MKTQNLREFFARLFGPVRVFTLLILVIIIYLLPFNSKSEFIQHNRQIVEVPNNSPILKSLYPEGAYATCGAGGTGTNCHTGCCSAGACVVCPPRENEDRPPNIAATLNCPQPGANNWCLDSLSIDLSASDPQGYAVLISGTFAGNPFACPVGNTTCSIPVTTEGEGTISYRVDSSSGLFDSDSTSYKLDFTTPELNGSISGVTGNNSWYQSNAVLEISASDSISGIASITTTVDGGSPTAYTSPITFSAGSHSVVVTASDQAGNTTQITQTIQVDTFNPSINVALGGSRGNNDWYISMASITPSATDSGSGIASFEILLDNGAWTTVNGSSSLPDGIHTYKLRATDNAGNTTETPEQTIKVDTIAPFIDMTDKLNLGGTVYYNVEDYGSGLAQYRAVIEDDEERYQKVVWLEQLYENQFDGQIRWDGRFKDGTFAGSGEYFITLKITDAAGNKTIKSAIVQVNPLSILQDIPAFTPPATVEDIAEEEDSPAAQTSSSSQTEVSASQTSFGGESNPFAEGSFVSTVFGVPATTTPIADIPLDSAILWGAAATALVGFTVGNWEQDRERERQEKEKAKAEKRANTERRKKQKEYEDSVRERWQREAAEEAYLKNYNQHMQDKMADFDAADDAKWETSQIIIQERERKEKERLNAVDAARWAGLAQIEQAKQEEESKTTWAERVDNAWNLAYNNQTDLALGTGVVAGFVAAGLILAGVAISPLVLIAGAVVLTAAVVTAGTIALNHHFEQDWNDNLGSNLLIGTIPALLLPLGAALLAPAMPWISTTATGLCVQYATACSQVGNVIDFAEEAMLATQLAYYNWTDNQDEAALVTIELQLEKMDGGAPGNSFAIEATEQIVKLGPDAMELAGKYGADAISLMLRYRDDAVDIIGAYGDEGISLLLKHGEDAVKLIKEHGTPAVNLMTTYGDDAIEIAETYGNNAIGFMTNAQNLGIDPTEILSNPPEPGQSLNGWLLKITDLNNPVNKPLKLNLSDKKIYDLANSSIHPGENNEFVLGYYDKAYGYIGLAKDRNASYFSMDESLYTGTGFSSDAGDFWLVNQQAIKNAVEERKVFVLNTKYDAIDKGKSTWAEVSLILQSGNNYKLIEGTGDEYDMLVPIESLP